MKWNDIRGALLSRARRVVVKLGSSVVTHDQGLDQAVIQGLADDMSALRKHGKEFIIVSSGAIAAGVRRMNLKEGARTIPQKQAAAAVGQSRLVAAYGRAFQVHGHQVGQLLLTKDDLSHRRRYLNARNTLMTLLSWGAIPIVNENDTVMVEEIQLGDNDNLSAMVATLAEADVLLLLTDTDGLMDCDPGKRADACLIPVVEEITPELRSLACDATSRVGRGGMASKIEAASKAAASAIPTVIARGKISGIVSRILAGEACGTLVLPSRERFSARKHWIRFNLDPEGTLVLDPGAARAVARRGTSLLPVGIVRVEGHFEHGAAVRLEDTGGNEIGIGLSNYSSEELNKIMGRQGVELDWVLGYRRNDEAIHADNLVLTSLVNGKTGVQSSSG